MKLEMRVVSVTEVPGIGKPTYNFVMVPLPDSDANRAVFGAAAPSAQLIVNNAQELPHGFGQQVTIHIGNDGEAEDNGPNVRNAAPPQPGQPMRIPSRNRP